MAKTWHHPAWGTFKHTGLEWSGKVQAPAFNAFDWNQGDRKTRPPQGVFELVFESEDEPDPPTKAMVAVTQNVLSGAEALVAKITAAFWKEFRGSGSGMWSDAPRPKDAEQIATLMRLYAITVRRSVDGYDKPVVELSFHAAFEEEHGVGVLTDGRKVVGVGYAADVRPYAHEVKEPEKKDSPKEVRGRIVVSGRAVSDTIVFRVERESSQKKVREWQGRFTSPPGWRSEAVGDGAILETEDGSRGGIFLLGVHESGDYIFYCPFMSIA